MVGTARDVDGAQVCVHDAVAEGDPGARVRWIENPVLRGFHPDPCLCAARGRYYLAVSTFQWVPGVSLYVSDDLVNWQSMGGALVNLDLNGIPDSAGIWAPDLTYDEASGTFWLVFTVCRQIDGIFKDASNYVITASDIEGPWSEPRFVNASGFDPGFFHEDGRHYVVNPQWDPRPLPGHHRFNGLIMQEFSLEAGLVGSMRTVLDNADAVNWLREGPHIMKRDGWYYLLCAEGGTGRRHRIRVARSRALWGPYEVDDAPLVYSWCSDAPLRKAGHGNLVEGPGGAWYLCHLTARYLPRRDGAPPVFDEREEGISPLGRETALQRVEWVDGWPRLTTGGSAPQVRVPIISPECAPSTGEERVLPGHAGYRYEADFSTYDALDELWNEGWLMPRKVDRGLARIGRTGLELAGGDSLSSRFDQAMLVRRVMSFRWRAEASLSFEPVHYNQSAGLACTYDARAFVYFYLGWDEERACRVLALLTAGHGAFEAPLGARGCVAVPDGVQTVTLSIEGYDGALGFSYAFDGGDVRTVCGASGEQLALDASAMSDECIDGWAYTGTMIGVTCIDMFDKTARAHVGRFIYEDRSGRDGA